MLNSVTIRLRMRTFKYQWLMLDREASEPCPPPTCRNIELQCQAYRFVDASLSNAGDHFLPNFLYDEIKSAPPRAFSPSEKCSRCALSFFESEDQARKKFKSFPQKVKTLLGFTDLCMVKLDQHSGKVTPGKDGHFSLFEFEGVDLTLHIKMVGALT